MAPFPGSPALGRGVVIGSGQHPPAECRSWPQITIDDRATTDAGTAANQLHRLWLSRRPVVVILATDPAMLRAPERCDLAAWRLDPEFEFARERLQYLLWSNNYDCRDAEPIWWHARRAQRLGATPGGPADVLLPDGTAAWCDGGPRQPLTCDGTVVVHRESIECRSLTPDRYQPPSAELAPDQLAAVAHPVGPARVIAPAGSGKTRVLTERLRHLLADRGYNPSTVTAVAYNKRAADEMARRTDGLGALIRTL
ncbi:MAG: UvrD-helicase domain-containing protein, partial [Pseudonocardiaceae bacterium]